MAEVLTAYVMEPATQLTGPPTWTYDLLVNFAGGPALVEGVTPDDERPSIDARSVPAGKVVIGYVDGPVTRWVFNEREDFAPCSSGGDGEGDGETIAGRVASDLRRFGGATPPANEG